MDSDNIPPASILPEPVPHPATSDPVNWQIIYHMTEIVDGKFPNEHSKYKNCSHPKKPDVFSPVRAWVACLLRICWRCKKINYNNAERLSAETLEFLDQLLQLKGPGEPNQLTTLLVRQLIGWPGHQWEGRHISYSWLPLMWSFDR